ncbi:UDP-N-acetylmuramoyl-L-alanyl-D-glutamate--2,6-diaminopimelate ligase [Euzebya sp.]|uniref:UDP-N-acetylmuramoyl-L-alanyl-D-glutamate--2, 6-diaminopimelate ligase n=1 Tax=Euzebya sp. TaxID=1971409 RepID=UPI0035178C26
MPEPSTPADIATAISRRTAGAARIVGHGVAAITDVTHDSRQAGPGVLFAARPGAVSDGHDFAAAAVAAGSPAVLVERVLDVAVPQIVVDDVAEALGHAAAVVHGDPTDDIAVLGVTGTNGKTTTTYLLDAVWRAAGHVTGLIGTVETRVAGTAVPGIRTTPEASDTQRLLARMRREGVTAASMEVSSHGLALGRLNGVRFAAALFTNLSQDHLDFHADMEDYFRAKARLFTPGFTPIGVVTVDDPWGARLAERADVEVWTLSRRGGADVTATDVVTTAEGATFTADVRGSRLAVRIALPGDYNVTNALGALATAHAAGVPLDVAAEGLATLPGVPGRMERVDVGQPFGVLVDYAHSPDSVAGVLAAARGVAEGRVIVVIGCGGDRDAAKRPLMARAAVAGADVAILTSDNPRSEDPEAILDDMVAGLADPSAARRITDRAEAIAAAVGDARPGDVVVIAGKGHEPYQELADGRIDFDDRLVARAALAGRVGR